MRTPSSDCARVANWRTDWLKEAGIPLIISIGTDWPPIDWESMFTALYGEEQVRLTSKATR